MELLKILNDFEELIEHNPKVPLTGKIIIAEDVILNFIDQVRTTLPDEVKQANWVAKERERILEEAKQEGEKILQDAQQHVIKIADESEVVKQAEMQADEILNKAQEDARQIYLGAYAYAEDLLKELGERMQTTLQSVEEGRNELGKNRSELEKNLNR